MIKHTVSDLRFDYGFGNGYGSDWGDGGRFEDGYGYASGSGWGGRFGDGWGENNLILWKAND